MPGTSRAPPGRPTRTQGRHVRLRRRLAVGQLHADIYDIGEAWLKTQKKASVISRVFGSDDEKYLADMFHAATAKEPPQRPTL